MRHLFVDNNNWTVIEKINSENYSIENEYFFKGKNAYKIRLESKTAENLAGYLLIQRDIKNIISWLDLLEKIIHKIYGKNIPKTLQLRSTPESEDYDLAKSLFVSLITFYGKLFVKAEGRKVKLEKNIYGEDEYFKGMHDELIRQRNDFVAHSGNNKIEGVNVVLLIDSDKNSNEIPIITREVFQPNAPSIEYINSIRRVMDHLKSKIDYKTSSIQEKIYNNIVSKGKHFYYKFIEMET